MSTPEDKIRRDRLEAARRRQMQTSRDLEASLQRAQQILTKIRDTPKRRKKPARSK